MSRCSKQQKYPHTADVETHDDEILVSHPEEPLAGQAGLDYEAHDIGLYCLWHKLEYVCELSEML